MSDMLQHSFGKDKIKVTLFEGIHANAVDFFKKAGYNNVELLPKALSGDELHSKLAESHIVGIRSRTQLSEEALSHAQKLVAIGCFCIGTNQVNLSAALTRGIPVFNAPYSNTRSVAELVLAEAIMLLRGVPEKSAVAHRGGWQKTAANSYEARGKVLGIIGYGNIGSQLSVLAEAIGMKVRYYDTSAKLPLGNAEQVSSLDELLSIADVVSLHVPESPATKMMIGKKELAKMKAGSILINASRGTVVEIDALADALQSKHIGGAAVDVFPVEPKSNDDEFISPLREFDNVILTPHVGGSTQEAQANIGTEVAEKLVRYSDNGSTLSSVNFPQVALPAHPEQHRLLHIHINKPGILSKINDIFSNANINIAGQYLQTNADIGYVVIDVDAQYSQHALAELKQIDGTIKARRLF